MEDLRTAKAWCISLIFWGLGAPSQGLPELGGLLGSASKAGGDGASGKDGLLGSGSGGGDSLLGSGKGSILPASGGLLKDTTGALLGNGSLSGSGVLMGEKGLLDVKGLASGDLLGQDGLLGGNKSLQDLLGGNLLGLEGLLKESGDSKQPFNWWDALNLETVRGSWKVMPGAELVLSLQTRVIMNFPGSLKFLSGSSVEMNVTAHLAVVQNKPGELRLVLKNCEDMAGGLTIHLRKRIATGSYCGKRFVIHRLSGFLCLLTNLVSRGMNAAIRSLLPAMICPVFQIWFSLVNEQLRILNDKVFFGLLGKIHTTLSSMPISTGQFSEIDLKDKPFPGAFLQWLLKFAGPDTSQKSS